MIGYGHASFNDCSRSGRQARAVESVATWFESREGRLSDLPRSSFAMTAVAPKIRCFSKSADGDLVLKSSSESCARALSLMRTCAALRRRFRGPSFSSGFLLLSLLGLLRLAQPAHHPPRAAGTVLFGLTGFCGQFHARHERPRACVWQRCEFYVQTWEGPVHVSGSR
jgi:hypothetical protein